MPSLALGSSPLTLLIMIAAYASIANGGSYMAPVLGGIFRKFKGN